ILLKMLARVCSRHVYGSVRQMSNISNVETIIDSQSGIATVKMSQPPVNSLDKNLLTSITDTFKNLEKDSSISGVLLTSKFDGRVFSSGLNITDMFQQSDGHLAEFWSCVQEWYLTLYGFGKPLVSAINGHSPAGGCAMALMSDYRVMEKQKSIGLNETQLGIVAPFFFADLMIATVGRRIAEIGLNMGKLYSSEEALTIGLVDEVTDLESVVPNATKTLLKLTKIPQPAYKLSKQVQRNSPMETLRNDRAGDVALFVNIIQTSNVQAAIGGYLKALKQKKK
uniref:Enoyl-CoA delta isomerase 1, mitochondrial n=1 Tax=Ciona savignyi TaxID=51511 RepID=H2YHF4_CIOSA